jgi:tetratricopeptide (TPR) repeat protein
MRARRPAEALPLFKAALALNPADAGALIGLGLAHRAVGENPAALDALRRALAVPSITPAQRELAEARIRDIAGIGNTP